MNHDPSQNHGSAVEQYLDDRRDMRPRPEFPGRLASDADLRGALRLQERIDGALRRRFVAPAPDVLLGAVLPGERTGAPPSRSAARLRPAPRWGRWAVAASILLLLGAGNWYMWRSFGPAPRKALATPTFQSVYRETVAAGFKADWLCENERQFATAFWQRFGQGLMLAAAAPGVQWDGVSYRRVISGKTLLVLAHVDDHPVLVVVDKLPASQSQIGGTNASLRHFEHKVGELYLYEITPLDGPRLLALFRDPQLPAEWYDRCND
jgi:hypothetical protein